MISKLRIEDHLQQYKRLDVPTEFNNKIEYIVNGIQLPQQYYRKYIDGPLQVLYVGRGTEEKRVYLIAKMSALAASKNLPVEFIFMGDVANSISEELLPFCKLLGPKKDAIEIERLYQQADVVIITSSTEGFPMVIEEGMANGCAIMSTPVGDIPYHVKHGVNGFLFSSVTDEALIIREGVDYLKHLCGHKNLIAEMGEINRKYAIENFGIEAFNNKYRQLFNQLRNQ
jgi:glycosyltransferase involved in cell wall biosynthesis